MTITFSDKLRAAQTANNSWLCVGLDPVRHPATQSDDAESLLDFCRTIVDVTADIASVYKPNLAYFLRKGGAGIDALTALIAHIPEAIPVILDAKFGDIGQTQAYYAQFAFEQLKVHAVTLNPYVGTDALTRFLPEPSSEQFGHGIFVLCRTSNADNNEFQPAGIPPLYEQVARQMVTLAQGYPGQVGLVVGATQASAELAAIRAVAPRLPFLIPGVGRQGGSLEAAVQYGSTAEGLGPVINVSSDILYAQSGPDFAEAARSKAIAYRDQINRLRLRP